MFEISVIIICLCTLVLLKIFLNINFKDIKKMEIKETEIIENISNKFPPDEKMCNDILKMLNNESVKIKINLEYNSCLYTVFNNTITLGKFERNYMKPQTIAHECIHSCQNKRMLWANFIFTNIYLLYFIIIFILTLFNKIQFTSFHIVLLIFLSFIQYAVRFNLESDAMIKAKYIAKEYIEEINLLTKEEEKELLKVYDNVNEIGIPFMNYSLISNNIIKIILYAFISLI